MLWDDGELVLSRAVRGERLPPLLTMAPVSSAPAPDTVARLEHAYALRNELDPAWAARPLALLRHDGRPTLLIEDAGGEVLAGLVGRAWDVGPFLRVAIGLAAVLRRLHARGLVHKAIRPANLLVNVATGQVWLTGFGVASRLPREPQPAEPTEVVAGSLAYVAPEQTGRMNRSVDQRSDLYSLGVTLYEMLTGALPFTASDPMEWVHSHVARQPPPPAERRKDVPFAISAIIMKLLAKTAEERYQTAAGVEHDLQRCLAAWDNDRWIGEFPLGQNDTPDRLLIPERLYGRASEIETLLASFERVVANGTPELVLVSGYSGIGKSSLVNELHTSLVPSGGLFASGKFDQYKRDVPYPTLAQAFQSLVRRLLGKSEAELRIWRDALREALGPNGLLIVDLVPELQHIIGEQPPVPVLPPQDAQRRFQLVFRRFLGVFARPEHPLVLFLDDLQWLDPATLDVIEDLLTQSDVQHLMLIGAYRDNEVTSSHPLMRTLDTIRTAGAIVHELALAPLTCEDLARLLTDSLHCEPERATALAHLLHEKTECNPFFAIQFVSTLAEEGLLAFDHGERRWSWDLNRIRAHNYTDNVVHFLIAKLNRLPAETQNALQLLACIGDHADLTLLRIASQSSDNELHGHLWEAIRAGLIFHSADSYRFLHDRVREAAYSLIPEASRAEAHLRIGRLLAAQTPPEKREERIFEIVNQLNRGAALITSRDEREQLADLNLIAGKRAKASTAYSSALKYFSDGAALLVDHTWERRHELIFALELHRAECEFLTGQSAAAEQRLTELASRAADILELATVTCLQVDLYTSLVQNDRAVAVCLDYLRRVGIEWSPHPAKEDAAAEYARIWSQLGTREIEELIDLPLMSDAASLATLDVLTKVLPPALFTDANLLSLAICRAVNLSLERGNSDGSCVAYGWLGQIAGPHFGNYKGGFRFGLLGYELVDKRGLMRFQARTCMVLGSHVMPWAKHVRAGRDLIRRTFEVANRVGDLCFAAYSFINLNTNLLAAGDPLPDVQREAEKGLEFAQKIRFGFPIDVITVQLQLIRTLRGATSEFGCFGDEQFEELHFEHTFGFESAFAQPECYYWVRKLQARFLAGDYASAVDASLRAQRLLWSAPSNFETVELHYYGALSLAAAWDSSSAGHRQEVLDALAAHHRQLAVWAENCPENFENRAALVGAEIARIEGRDLDAMHLYEHAVHSARTNAFVHNEGIASELAARFHRARGFEQIADLYLRNARDCYRRWGAEGKVRRLEELHAPLREQPMFPNAAAIAAPIDRLDLAAAVRASQAVSGEIVLEKVIETLLVLALQQAGAERGLLILSRGDELRIEAEATTVASRVTVRRRDDDATATDLPASILRYVARTRQSVIVDDAWAENPYVSDPYLQQRHARSILCLPLVKQAALVGVLYLENTLAPGIFTPARIELSTLLASQAALSLENASLYSDLKQAERNVRLTVDSIPGLIWSARADGGLDFVNQRAIDFAGGSGWVDAEGWGWLSSAHPDDVRVVLEKWKAHLASGEPYDFEVRLRGADGGYRSFMTRAAPLRDETGAIVRWYGTSVDIQDRKEAEQALARKEKEVRDLIDSVPQHIVMLDANGRRLYANRAALEYFGCTVEELCAPDFLRAVCHPDHFDELRSEREQVSRGEPFDLETRMRASDGTYRWFVLRYRPFRDEDGRIARWYVTTIDVEDRKRTEERLQTENLVLREEIERLSMFEEIVGTSPRLRAVLANVSRVAPTDSTVLVTGETGTGKELVARAIHKRSRRSSRAFVSVNCAAIPPTLIASELFGHEKGAFTGALTRRIGRFELADGGTIFLDEIGDLPPDTQLALLRVLQEREFERLGSTRPMKVDVRVIAATNRDLKAAVASSTFRADLFYRLNVFPIEVPPLRERTVDIPLLVAYFVDRYASNAGKTIRHVDKRSVDLIQSYPWPGNVRELQNVIERAVIVCATDTLVVDENWLPREIHATSLSSLPLDDVLIARERQMIEAALAESKGKVSGPSGAAAKLGIPASTLESKIRTLRIRKGQFKRR